MNSLLEENIESLVKEYKNIKYSKNYFRGLYIEESKKNLKKFRFIKFLKCVRKAFSNDFIFNKVYSLKNETKIMNDIDFSNKKIAIYTCITGNYDNIREPFIDIENIDFILFTDNTCVKSNRWIVKNIPSNISDKYSGSLINRYLKFHPYEILKDYDYTMYVDGNVLIISNPMEMFNGINLKYGIAMHKHSLRNDFYDECDFCISSKKGNKLKINEQKEKYSKEFFPRKYGLNEATVILTEIDNAVACSIYEKWWEEFLASESMRDQLSLPYVLWKKGIKPDDIGTLGNCVYTNKHLLIDSH